MHFNVNITVFGAEQARTDSASEPQSLWTRFTNAVGLTSTEEMSHDSDMDEQIEKAKESHSKYPLSDKVFMMTLVNASAFIAVSACIVSCATMPVALASIAVIGAVTAYNLYNCINLKTEKVQIEQRNQALAEELAKKIEEVMQLNSKIQDLKLRTGNNVTPWQQTLGIFGLSPTSNFELDTSPFAAQWC